MDQRKRLIVGGLVVGVGVAGLLVLVQRRAAQRRATPAWSDPQQPPLGTAGQPVAMQMAVPTTLDAWGAARPGHPAMGGSKRVMRHYATTLKDDPGSLVR